MSQDVEKLWRDYRATKDEGLRNRLVLQYAPLVKYVGGRLRTRMPDTVEQHDVVSDGVLGLIGAIERFEPGGAESFQTFAVPRIQGAIVDGMRSRDLTHGVVSDPALDSTDPEGIGPDDIDPTTPGEGEA